jgi:hypothetical protein
MTYPLVRDLAAEGISVRLTCGVLGHSTQAYYAWVRRPVSRRDLDDAYLTNALIDAHGDDPEFGYRLLSDELVRLGAGVGERRVWRLCSQQKLWSATVRKGRRGRPAALAHPRRAPRRRRALGRAHRQQPAPPTPPRQAHPRRVRARLHPTGRNRGMLQLKQCQPDLQQTHANNTAHRRAESLGKDNAACFRMFMQPDA